MAALDVKLITCRTCGVVMVKLSKDVCPKCYQEDEDVFMKVKDYVRANPNSQIEEISAALGIPADTIAHYVNSGRLERTGVNIQHECQTCHKIISSGIICQDCGDTLKTQVTELKKVIAEMKETKSDSLWKKDEDKK